MIVYKTWVHDKKNIHGQVVNRKIYRVLLLLGIIPLFIWIDGK